MGPAEQREHQEAPPLPAWWYDPRPVLALGSLAWAVGLVACLVLGAGTRAVALCAVGVGVGAAGFAVYALQRRGVRRGSAGAQEGAGLTGR